MKKVINFFLALVIATLNKLGFCKNVKLWEKLLSATAKENMITSLSSPWKVCAVPTSIWCFLIVVSVRIISYLTVFNTENAENNLIGIFKFCVAAERLNCDFDLFAYGNNFGINVIIMKLVFQKNNLLKGIIILYLF